MEEIDEIGLERGGRGSGGRAGEKAVPQILHAFIFPPPSAQHFVLRGFDDTTKAWRTHFLPLKTISRRNISVAKRRNFLL